MVRALVFLAWPGARDYRRIIRNKIPILFPGKVSDPEAQPAFDSTPHEQDPSSRFEGRPSVAASRITQRSEMDVQVRSRRLDAAAMDDNS